MGDKKQKQYLTGTVHRLHEGVLVSHYAGEEAPEWVTNPKVLTGVSPNPEEPANTTNGTPPADPKSSVGDVTNDDLTDLDGKALKAIADELGVRKSGKLTEIADRIRAKRAESNPAPSSEDAERAALIESLKAQGLDVDETLTDAELQALAEQE